MVHRYPKTIEQSFAAHLRANCWSKKNKYKPEECCLKSGVKYIFNCNICQHEFSSTLDNITKGQWCPYCSGSKICGKKDCKSCFDRSFASHYRSVNWSLKNTLTPIQCALYTCENIIFDCSVCNHEFECRLSSIVCQNSWCPYCSNPPKLLCALEDCKQCFKKSFASSKMKKFWNYEKNNVNPRDIFISSSIKCWFKCNHNHIFNTRLADISKGKWCPKCKNKTEKKLYEWLYENYSNIESQIKFDWCKNINDNYLPFDFILKDYKIIIELDGDQHFNDIKHFNSLVENVVKTDQYKLCHALQNDYTMIRIYQPDVYNDKNDWQFKLALAIECHKRDMDCLTFIASDNDVYKSHMIGEPYKYE